VESGEKEGNLYLFFPLPLARIKENENIEKRIL